MFQICCAKEDSSKEEVIAEVEEGLEPSPHKFHIKALIPSSAADNVEILCTCEVPGRTNSVVQGTFPFESQVPGFKAGDELRIGLLATKTQSTIGEATLPVAAFRGGGFTGEIPLIGGSQTTASHVLLCISAEDGSTYPPEPAAANGYRATIQFGGSADTTTDIDLMDRVYARINTLTAPIDIYNQKVADWQKVQVDDFIYSVNGSRWSREFAQKFKEGKELTILVKRPTKYPVTVSKANGTLGLDLWYENDSSPALLVTKVNDGAVSVWNSDHPEQMLQRFDRIVAVNGQVGNASSLLQMIRDAPGTLQLSTVRPSSDGPSCGPVDVSSLTKMAANDAGMLPQPAKPRAKAAMVQIYVRGHEFGGRDKSASGHRYDSIPLANGMIQTGMSCQLLHYVHQEHDQFFDVLGKFDVVLLRCAPGQIREDGGDQAKFDKALAQLASSGTKVLPNPAIMEKMGGKKILAKLAQADLQLEDTQVYTQDFAERLKRSIAQQPRVVKQNFGSAGEGVWQLQLKSGNYCKNPGDRICDDHELLTMVEASDNHEEWHSIGEFVEFCVNGLTEKAGKWKSTSKGAYLAGGPMVDQQFFPRVTDGELLYSMLGDTCIGILYKKPRDGGFSTVEGTGPTYTVHGPGDEKFASISSHFFQKGLPAMQSMLGISGQSLPIWWTVDFVQASEGKWVVSDVDCLCPGIPKCLEAACTSDRCTASYSDIGVENRLEATRLGGMIAERMLASLD